VDFGSFEFTPAYIALGYVAFIGAGLIAGVLAVGFTAFGRR
jgi:hypothetical protein